MKANRRELRRRRIENALWGLFVADALAMPAHWIYDTDTLRQLFDGGIEDYCPPPHPHPESFMVGMSYKPDVASAEAHDRGYDILGPHARYYDTSYSALEISTDDTDPQHGNATPSKDSRYHYHHGLQPGQNTLGAELARLLMRNVVENGGYDEASFLHSFIEYMLAPEQRADPYTEIYLRKWFESYADGKEPIDCACRQRENWSIASMGGMIRPLLVSLLSDAPDFSLGLAVEHMSLTHRSETIVGTLGSAVPLLEDLVAGRDPLEATLQRSSDVHEPRINGDTLFREYREADGPSNLPPEKLWEMHTELRDEPWDLRKRLATDGIDDVVNARYATACYPEHGWPLLLFIAAKCGFDPRRSILANANAGGDNVHRGCVLGLLVGAAQADGFPDSLKRGLASRRDLEEEIPAFAEVAARGHAY